MSNTILNQLEQAQKEYEAKKQELQASFEKKRADLLGKVKTELAQALSNAAKIYEAIPDDARGEVWADAMYSTFLTDLRLAPKSAANGKANGKTGQGSGKRVSEERLLAFLAKERSTPEISKEFSFKNPSQRLNGLKDAGKITVREVDGTKLWTAAKS